MIITEFPYIRLAGIFISTSEDQELSHILWGVHILHKLKSGRIVHSRPWGYTHGPFILLSHTIHHQHIVTGHQLITLRLIFFTLWLSSCKILLSLWGQRPLEAMRLHPWPIHSLISHYPSAAHCHRSSIDHFTVNLLYFMVIFMQISFITLRPEATWGHEVTPVAHSFSYVTLSISSTLSQVINRSLYG